MNYESENKAPVEGTDDKELFVAYWQGFTKNGPPPDNPPSLTDTPEFIDVICLAFAAPGENSTIVTSFLTKENSKESIISGTEVLQSRNQKVLMSINGSTTVPWGSLEPIPFAKSVKAVAKEWKLDGIDLDNETWGETPGKPFADVIKAIRDEMGNDFIITYPAYQPFRDEFLTEVQSEISWVMTMAYWNGFQDAVDLFDTYAKLIGTPAKVMMGVKPGKYGMSQSTPIADLPKIIGYQPPSGVSKAGAMMYSLSIDYNFWTDKPRFAWAEMINTYLPDRNEK